MLRPQNLKNMFQAQGLNSGQLEMKTPKLSSQQILKQAPKTTEVETLMDTELCQGHSIPDQQSATDEKHITPFERNTHATLTFGVSYQK